MALHAFSRTELLVGKPAMERLAQARVAVFGIGGVGGYTVEALARSGVGALTWVPLPFFADSLWPAAAWEHWISLMTTACV